VNVYLTDHGLVYHGPSAHLCRAKLITHFDDRLIMLKSRVQGFRKKVPLLCKHLIVVIIHCRVGGRKLTCKKNSSIRSFVSTELRLVTDGQPTQGHV